MQILQPQRTALPRKVDGDKRHSTRDVGSRAAENRVLGHRVGALERNHRRKFSGRRAAGFAEVSLQGLAFEGDLHAFERRPDHLRRMWQAGGDAILAYS